MAHIFVVSWTCQKDEMTENLSTCIIEKCGRYLYINLQRNERKEINWKDMHVNVWEQIEKKLNQYIKNEKKK